MQGYDVVTSDGEAVGTVVEETKDSLVVEHGLLRKSRRAIPRAFAHVDEDARLVRTTIAKRVIDESPKLEDGVDDAAVARYYGLAGGGSTPATEGYGEVAPSDPAVGAERLELATGLDPAASERAKMREHPEQLEDKPEDLRKDPPTQYIGRRGAY
jgi:hypothetical protein